MSGARGEGAGQGPGDPGPGGRPGVGAADEDAGPIGPFPSWAWVYGSVITYTAALVVLLSWLSSALDFGGP